MGDATHPTVTKAGLPKLVGYRELEEAFGFSRKQLDRMQKDGRFPRAMHITGAGGNRRAWELAAVLDWLDSQRNRVTSLAATDVSKLKPEQLDDAISNAVSELARRAGVVVPADSLFALHAPMTAEQQAAVQRTAAEQRTEAANALADAFAQLDINRACLVAGVLMPVLRPLTDRVLLNNTGIENNVPAGELRALAIDILDQAIVDGRVERGEAGST